MKTLPQELRYKGQAQKCAACGSNRFTSANGTNRPPFQCAWCSREWSPDDSAWQERLRQLETLSEVPVLLTPREAAAMFGVSSKTITRYANAGKLTTIRTAGGHRRFFELELKILLEKADTGD